MFEKSGTQKLVAVMAPVGLAVSLALGSASAIADSDDYLSNPGASVVLNGSGECWHAANGHIKDMAMCGAAMPAKAPKDSDGDGVPDARDECPNTPRGAPVNAFGCPKDSDGDGVPDYKDHCPNTTKGAKVDSIGCEIMGNVTIHTTTDHFDFDSAKLKPAMEAELNAIANKVNATPGDEHLEIIGHTDSTGPEAYNQGLSERRAQSAADFLSLQGIKNLIIKGMGESSPTADNGTREGRAANRRVEVRTK